MRKLAIVLLSLAAHFNLLFCIMVANHYSLQGDLGGLPVNAVVGVTSIILSAILFAEIRQSKLPASLAAFRPPWAARFILLSLPLWSWGFVVLSVGFSMFSFAVVWTLVWSVFIPGQPSDDWVQNLSVINSLLFIVSGSTAITLLFDWVATLIRQAALPRLVKLVAFTLQTNSLTLVIVIILLLAQGFGSSDPYCSKRYLSPSGQRSIVVEDYTKAEHPFSRAYFDGQIFRKDLGDFSDGSVCRNRRMILKWSTDGRIVDWKVSKSTDERQVDWKASNWQGRWRF